MEIAFVGIAVVIALVDVFGIERMVLVQADLGANTITNLLERTGHGALGIDIRTERARELVLQHQTIAPDVLAFAVIGLVLHLAAVHIGAAHGDLGAVGVLPTLAKRDVVKRWRVPQYSANLSWSSFHFSLLSRSSV